MQDFDYSILTNSKNLYDSNNNADKNEKEFYTAVADSSVHNIVFASYNLLFLYLFIF